ncbi:hypothetical protein Pve01_55560 [Planomonospora venezuelensis]|nr:hypothetical protein Pve01_55560 [Planomonospora venezuelensis]
MSSPEQPFDTYAVVMSEAAYEIPLEDLHAHPERWGEAVESAVQGKVITLTGRGKRLAAVVPAEQLDLVERLQETIDVLSDTEAVQAIVESRTSIAAGEGVRGVEAVRALLDQRR